MHDDPRIGFCSRLLELQVMMKVGGWWRGRTNDLRVELEILIAYRAIGESQDQKREVSGRSSCGWTSAEKKTSILAGYQRP